MNAAHLWDNKATWANGIGARDSAFAPTKGFALIRLGL